MDSKLIDLLCWFLWSAAAVFLFRANLHTDDAGILAGLLLVLAGLVSFLWRRFGRTAGSLLGLSVLASELWSRMAYGPRHSMNRPRDFVLLALFVTAVSTAGAFLGYGAGILSRRAHSRHRV